MCSKLKDVDKNLKTVGALQQDDVDERSGARATTNSEVKTNINEEDIPAAKKRKRRRRNKRRHPYLNQDRKSKVIKPEAPHNSNQFLIEDQGNSKQIDEQLRHDVVVGRTRDSSFSMDSDAEFYSSPDDDEAFLRKDFDDTYESLRAEQLNLMSKSQLIEEFMLLEKRLDIFMKRSKNNDVERMLKQIERLSKELASVKRDNSDLRNKLLASNSESKDSESDSSESCSSCSSSSSSSESAKDKGSVVSPDDSSFVDYTQTNGHSPADLQVT